MNNITPKEAIANLNHIYGMVAPDIQRSLDMAIKALERPQGDLISREALKEQAIWTKVNNGVELIDIEVVPLDAIDNAPPVPQVTVFTENADEKAIEDMKAELQSVLDSERPKGEWIAIAPYTHETFCPYCKEDSKDERYGNFCPNCGADMKGGAK